MVGSLPAATRLLGGVRSSEEGRGIEEGDAAAALSMSSEVRTQELDGLGQVI